MNRLIELAVRQPITVAVAVILAVMAGLLSATRVAVQMTPSVDSTVVSVTTTWENASAAEIESDVIEEQEARLGDIGGLISMTSVSQAGQGNVRLEFRTGTDIDEAMSAVDQKLSEVPRYPDGVDEPEVVAVDPESVDYIAWIGLSSTDPEFDATTLYDFMERRLRPRLERIQGVSEVGVRGAREAEVQILVDPARLAQRGITYGELVEALQLSNQNFSGGLLPDGKNDVRVRSVGRFHDPATVGDLVIRRDEAGPVYLRDIATVEMGFKEKNEWVRARGVEMPFFNFQLQQGANLLDTMQAIQSEVAVLNAPDGLLEQHARSIGIEGTLELVQTYDSSTYVEEAIALVRSNIFIGGALAVITLLMFLRSLRTIGIIAIAIPISVIASLTVLVLLGRSINIISLAGMAFATGMVVDNAIVVIENIFRHLEMGKDKRRAALDATKEVGGAVIASTATTLVVFFPILLIQDSAGQLFRDIALAIMAAVGISLIVSVTVIPAAASQILKQRVVGADDQTNDTEAPTKARGRLGTMIGAILALPRRIGSVPSLVGAAIQRLTSRWITRFVVIAVFATGTIAGIAALIPPLDYLPAGNRNIIFGVLVPPPGYNLDQLSTLGDRLEDEIRPSWEVTQDKFELEDDLRGGPSPEEDARTTIMTRDGREVLPPELEHYFLVAWDGLVFHAAIARDNKRIADALGLFDQSVAGANAPDVFSFSFQMPLFRTGGQTGSAIKIDLKGDDLDAINDSAGQLLVALFDEFGPGTVQPDPPNFSLPTPELRVTPNDERLRDLDMSRSDVGLAVAANGDGLVLPRQFQVGSELKDLKIISPDSFRDDPIQAMLNAPIATPGGSVVDLESLAAVERIRESDRIRHVDRQRAVTLQFTPPTGTPLQDAIHRVDAIITDLRADDRIAQGIEIQKAGSAGKLNDIKQALLGDGTIVGILSSSLFLAFLVVYLVMVVLFQSWTYPIVIMVSVPLATLGGFIGLAIVHEWSMAAPYTPVQNLDVLTILGFVILAGVVVNNAILIVHQTLNFMAEGDVSPNDAIAQAVQSRVRPIMMSTLTSVGGMLPLVLMPGSGSELYRGLGAVVVGGLLISTVFTLVLVPIVLSILFEARLRRPWTSIERKNAVAVSPATAVIDS
ncbi:MAG: efflux RND transporter permease subunit [Planctomycetota bacterium]